ncbi:MAG: phosphate uptake regulator PhoU [Candidatus Micrarchaeota archaeon]
MQHYRKVQKTGESSLSLSLPKPWAARFRVRPGTVVSILEQPDGTLAVSPKREKSVKSAKFDASGFSSPAELSRAFIAKYLSGYSVFEFSSEAKLTASTRSAITSQARRLIGLEVVEESERKVTVQDFFSPDGMSIERGLKRAHSITCLMQESLSSFLREGGKDKLELIADKDADVDRIRFLLLRQAGNALQDSSLMSSLGLAPLDCMQYADAVTSVERIGDDLVRAAANLSPACRGLDSCAKIAEFNDFAYSMQVLALKSFFSKSADDANAVLSLYASMSASRAALEKALSESKAPFQLGMAVDSIALVGNRGKHIAQVAINRALAGIP